MLFQGVLAYKPPDPVPLMIEMLNKQIKEEREKVHYQANKQEIDSLRKYKEQLIKEVSVYQVLKYVDRANRKEVRGDSG